MNHKSEGLTIGEIKQSIECLAQSRVKNMRDY